MEWAERIVHYAVGGVVGIPLAGFLAFRQGWITKSPSVSQGLEHGVTALFMCAIALLLWGLLPSKRVHDKHAIEKALPDYARYFELPEQEIQAGRQQKVTTLHHDENGKIIRVE